MCDSSMISQDVRNSKVISERLDQIVLFYIIIFPISKILGIKRFQVICNLSVRQQSIHAGFRPLHSTEMTLLQVCSDLLLDEDWSGCSVLVLLDINTVLDTVDRTIIINRLERRAGVTDTALLWFRSYFFNISLYHWSSANVSQGVAGWAFNPVKRARSYHPY